MNKLPEEVVWSAGKLCKSWAIWLWNRSWNRWRAQVTQSSKFLGKSSTRTFLTFSIVSTGCVPCNFIVFSTKSDSERYWRADKGDCVNVPSKASLALKKSRKIISFYIFLQPDIHRNSSLQSFHSRLKSCCYKKPSLERV